MRGVSLPCATVQNSLPPARVPFPRGRAPPSPPAAPGAIGGHSWPHGDRVCVHGSREKGCFLNAVEHAMLHPQTGVK